MKFKITHSTEYTFDSEVFLEPHYLRFRPRQTSYLDVLEYSISIQSEPEGHKVLQDEDNNVLDFCWFEGMTDQFTILVISMLETKDFNPFDFILYPEGFNKHPFKYDELQKKLMFSALEKQTISNDLIEYGSEILKRSNFNTIQYLTQLTNQLHDDFNVVYREAGSPFLPDDTFQLREGSCRDLSWMQINLLRHQGIAARFVSGYYYFDMEEPAYELHAWVEVFLPGGGWVGFDPSHGILTGNTHFPIASSAYFQNTMPVSGGIRGSATSQLKTQLIIEKI